VCVCVYTNLLTASLGRTDIPIKLARRLVRLLRKESTADLMGYQVSNT